MVLRYARKPQLLHAEITATVGTYGSCVLRIHPRAITNPPVIHCQHTMMRNQKLYAITTKTIQNRNRTIE